MAPLVAAPAKAGRKKRSHTDVEEKGLESAEAAPEVRRGFFFVLPHPCIPLRPDKGSAHPVRQPQHAQPGNTAPVPLRARVVTQKAAGVSLF